MGALLTPILQGNWSVIARVVLVVLILLSVLLGHQLDANYNYHKGYDKAVIEHPQTVISSGGKAIIYQGPKMTCFPIHLGHWGLGICKN